MSRKSGARQWKFSDYRGKSDTLAFVKSLLAALLTLPLVSCTELGTKTALYYPSGRVAFQTAGDNTGIKVNIIGVGSFEALTNTHSTTVLAHGSAYSQVITAAGNSVGQGAKAFSKP